MRRFRRLSCAAASVALCAPVATGCNAMLGIGEPSDTLLDEAYDPSIARDAALPVVNDRDGGSPSADASADAGDGPRLPPSAFPRAAWRMPNAADSGILPAQAYTTEVDGVVRDTVTQLDWQQVSDGEARSFADAEAYCAALELDGGGFRVPARIELTSLLDLGEASPAIDVKAFPEAQPERFWSSSGYAGASERAWLVSFSFSTSHVSSDGASELHLVRCVRTPKDSPDVSAPDLQVAEDTVTDSATGLTWQRAAGTELVDPTAAAEACATLDLGGKGFRLPTLQELHTIVAEELFAPAIDRDAFPATPSEFFWTGSHVVNFNEYTWTVSFSDGADVWVSGDAKAFTRCVRSES